MNDTSQQTTVAEDPPTPQPPARPRRWRAALPWVVTVLALLLAAWTTWQWWQLADRQASVDAARATATTFVQDLSTWDASNGLEDEIDRLRAQGTGPLLDEIDLVFGGDELTSQLEADSISATGEIEEVFVQDMAGDLAEVFAVVSVTYASPSVEAPLDPVTFPASLVLERGGAGGWQVREVTIPNSEQLGQLIAPPT